MGHIFKDCPLKKKLEDTPKSYTAPSRIDSPVIQRSLALGPTHSANNPPKIVDEDRKTLSPPIIRSQAAVEAAKASGTTFTPLISCISHCSSLIALSIFALCLPPLLWHHLLPLFILYPHPPLHHLRLGFQNLIITIFVLVFYLAALRCFYLDWVFLYLVLPLRLLEGENLTYQKLSDVLELKSPLAVNLLLTGFLEQ